MVRQLLVFIVCVFGCLALFTQSASAEDDLSLDITSDFVSDYMYRGRQLYDGISIQPEIAAALDLQGGGQIGGSVWAHLSAEGASNDDKFSEVDFVTHFAHHVDIFDFELGHTFYTFQSSDTLDNTQEFYGKLAFNEEVMPFVEPSLAMYWDYDELDYQYYELSFMAKAVAVSPLGEGFQIDPYVTFGFASSADKVYDDNGLEHVDVGYFVDFQLGDVVLTPNMHYTFAVDKNAENEFWIGIGVGLGLM